MKSVFWHFSSQAWSVPNHHHPMKTCLEQEEACHSEPCHSECIKMSQKKHLCNNIYKKETFALIIILIFTETVLPTHTDFWKQYFYVFISENTSHIFL